MGVTCPVCGTENRSVAKFCIECIEPLPTIFAATELLPHLPNLAPSSRASHRTALLGGPDVRDDTALPRPSGFIAAPSAAPAAPAASATAIPWETPPISSGPSRTVEGRKGLWVSVAAFAIALVIGAAGWLVAGAGGLYIYAFGHSSAGAEPEMAMVTSPLASQVPLASAPVVPVVPLSPLSQLSPSYPLAQPEPSNASPLPTVLLPASAVVTALVNGAAPKSIVTPTPSTTLAAPVAVRATKPSISSPTLDSRGAATTTVIDPNAQCIGLGFFAVSRCMVVQCAKVEYSAHASCAGVRQQQRLMEEKRNPTMAN